MIDQCIEVFMDDFSLFGSSFNNYLVNRIKFLHRCNEKNLTLNWGNYHFMVKKWISHDGIEVEKVKIDLSANLSPSIFMKHMRLLLGHVGFYIQFIQDFRKIGAVKPKMCLSTSLSILCPSIWREPFELMCDAYCKGCFRTYR